MKATNWLEEEGIILIVDDLKSNRQLLKSILKGYQLFEAENVNQALAIMEERGVDLVLLDIMMPDASGYDLCKAIKSHDLWRSTQVVMVSALRDAESRIQAIAAGADEFISRPFHIYEMRARVKSSLRVKQYYDQMESLDTILFMLAATVESKDQYTEGHLKRIANFAEKLAELAELTPRQQSVIRYGATLHDIGKIAVPDSILGKPGKLTPEEFEVIKTHAAKGAQIVQSMRVGKELGAIIRGHHERWDGRGYPDGLAGEQIHIGARIVSICDVYDAITTARSYKPALSRAAAIQELLMNAGSQFDPRLVELFVGNVESVAGEEGTAAFAPAESPPSGNRL